MYFAFYSPDGHLGHVTWIIYINIHSPFARRLHMKFCFDCFILKYLTIYMCFWTNFADIYILSSFLFQASSPPFIWHRRYICKLILL